MPEQHPDELSMHILFVQNIEHEGKPAIVVMPAHYDAMEQVVEPINVNLSADEFVRVIRNDMDGFCASSVVELMSELEGHPGPASDRYAAAYSATIVRLAQQPKEFLVNLLSACIVGFVETIDNDQDGAKTVQTEHNGHRPEPGATSVE